MRLALILCLTAAPALAQSLDDRHLSVIPRTPAEAGGEAPSGGGPWGPVRGHARL